MYVVVNHLINDPAKFWPTAEAASKGLPKGLAVIHSFPSPDGKKATCLWEADSVDAVRRFLDPPTAGMARNEYYEVLNKEGMALPTLTRAAGA